ncbi:AraC family transcriptional regulator [Microbaculum marinum]|uniref:Helix-turn-helix domain-containing protein n=1 Tax=Microbaculum marinum TaxID=1764581 RepID=A0AAW9RX36_9HYPH
MRAHQASVPLARYNLFRTRDLDEARETVGRVFCPHRLAIAGEGRRFHTVQNHVDAGLLSLSYIDYGAEVEIEPGELGSFYLIQIPLEGGATIRTGGRMVAAHKARASILNPTHYTAMTWHAGCRKLQVQVPRAVLDRFARDYLGREFEQSVSFEPAMDLTSPNCAAWLRHVVAFARHLEHAGVGATTGERRGFYAAELLRELFEAQPNTHSHFAGSHRGGPVPRYIKLALDFIRAHADRPLTCNDIAAACEVAGRTLQHGFQHHLGTTPMQALRDERLRRCRLDLLHGDTGRSVAETASAWGFAHLGRFSQYYRERFGELPRETARRA